MISVSAHALIRYIERVGGIDTKTFRLHAKRDGYKGDARLAEWLREIHDIDTRALEQEILSIVGDAARLGCSAVFKGEWKYIIRTGRVVSIVPRRALSKWYSA